METNKINWHTEKRKLSELKPAEYNPRQASEKQYQDLDKSLTKFNLVDPIIINTDNTIIGGHFRYKVLKDKSGGKDLIVDVRVPDRKLSDAEVRELNIRLNKNSGEWNFDLLANFDEDLLTDIGFESMELDKVFQLDICKENDILSTKDEEIDAMGKIYDLKTDYQFEGIGKYDLPILREDMILNISELSTWAGKLATKTLPPYLYNYGTDSTIDLDFSKTVVSFYTDDIRFERLWTHTPEITKRFLNKKILGIISPNWSTYFKMPCAMRIYNIYRSRWVSRYMQEAGIKVIPDISGSNEDIDFCFDGIPQNSVVCIQAHRKYTLKEQKQKGEIIEAMFEKLKPIKVLLYAPIDRIEMFPVFKKYAKNILLLAPRTILHQKHKEEIEKGG